MSDVVPPDVLAKIFSFLPVKSLLRFRSVSKPVCCLIDSPYFVNLHMQQQSMKTNKVLVLFNEERYSTSSFRSFDLDSFPRYVRLKVRFDKTRFSRFLNACHGLVCISTGSFDRHILLWNPATRKHKVIWKPVDYPHSHIAIINITRLGYDHVNDDYKVVRLSQVARTGRNDIVSLHHQLSVYSLKMNFWRIVKQGFGFPFRFPLKAFNGQGVCVNGTLHYLVNQKPDPEINYLIISYNLASQRCGLMSQPVYPDNYEPLDLGVLGGCLCVVGKREHYTMGVWVMKEYGVKESWSKLLVLTMESKVNRGLLRVRPIAYMKNGNEVLLEIDLFQFMIYDLKEKKPKEMLKWNVNYGITMAYHESLLKIGQEL